MKRFYGLMGNASKFLKDLKLVESSYHGWTAKYVGQDGQQWLKYMVDRDTGRYYNLMLISPQPTTEEMIEIALTSDDHDEVEGASHRLFFEEEEEKKDFRPRLVERLQAIDISGLSNEDKKRLRTVIVNTNLSDQRNKREVIGRFAERLLNQIAAA
jgi:hypothetical protein